ncbi:MAG: tetratricopeptide repeat protein [Brevinematia bacterium]
MLKKILLTSLILSISGISFGSYESAYAKYTKGDISGSISEITKDIFSGIKDYRLHLLMVKIYKDHVKDYKQGIEYAIEGIRLFPDKEKEFSLEIGELYHLSGKYDKSEQILLEYNAKYPGDSRCLFLIGKNYFSQGKYYKATVSIESAMAFGGKSIEAYEYLGKSYRKVGKYNKALEILSLVYNQTRKEEILGLIIEISSIIDVDYSSYLNIKRSVSLPQEKKSIPENTSKTTTKRESQLSSPLPLQSNKVSANIGSATSETKFQESDTTSPKNETSVNNNGDQSEESIE